MTIPSESQPLSLLNANEDNTPLLGGVSSVEESPLERLIAQSTLEQAVAASTSFFIEDPQAGHCQDSEFPRGPSPADIYRVSVTTLVAATFCLLHICFVWSSFLSTAWFETHLTVSVEAGTTFNFTTDQVLQQTTLASLLSLLLEKGQEWPATVLVMTCLISPCLCMILCTSWTCGDYQNVLKPRNSRMMPHIDVLGFNPRLLVEQLMIRVGFLVFFLLAILDIGASSIAMENSNSKFLLTNRSLGGLVCYVLGTSSALVVVVVLRFASQEPYKASGNRIEGTPRQDPSHTVVSPDNGFSQLRQPLLALEDFEGMAHLRLGHPERGCGLAPWKRLLAYESGVLSVALWLPALLLPLFRMNFDGLVANFMEERAYEISFYQIPVVLLQRGNVAGTPQWITLGLGAVFVSLVYIFPLMATSIAVGAWRSPDLSKAAWFYKGILRHLQPCLCGVVFSVALSCAIPAFEPLVDGILDSETAGFCKQFSDITDVMCLVVEGQPRIGHWFLLAQSVSLELFVFLTLLWKP